MDMLSSVEVIVGTYEELTLGYRLTKDSEQTNVACVLRFIYVASLFQTNCDLKYSIFTC